MNRRSLAVLAVIVVLSGVAALAGGRRLGPVIRPDSPAALPAAAVTPAADLAPVPPPQAVRAAAE